MNDEPENTEGDQGYDTAAGPWLEMIKDAEKCFSKYQEKADTIDKLYDNLDTLSSINGDREFQIFWANLEVLKPSIYARPPVAVVTTRFRNRKDLQRKAADLMERTLITSTALDEFHLTMKDVRDDLATNARGAMWCRYEAEQGEDGSISERVVTDHVDRKDFLHDPARKWKEVEWVARRSWLSSEKGIARFGEGFKAAEFKDGEGKEDEYKGEKKAAVWEIWHKTKKIVVWISPGIEDVLDVQPPFLLLDRFFPCPRPAFGTTERGSLKPVPDFLYYKDQVEEINEMTARISALSEALRMKGFYAGGSEDVASAIETAMKKMDNNALLIPVANFAALGGQGLKDSIVWMPVKEVAETVTALISLRRQLIEDVYQITGISDIMRGESDASETLGAQQLKSQYGSVRVRDRQEELVRIARDAIAIMGEIIAENFQPETLIEMSQMQDDLPTQAVIQQQVMQAQQQLAQMQQQAQAVVQHPQAQAMAQQNPEQAQQVVQQAQQAMEQVQGQVQTLENTVTLEAVVSLLREQRLRPFMLDIETDSTIQPDEDAAKKRATEFITAIGGFMQGALPLVQAVPVAAPMAAGMLKYAASHFRAGRELDSTIEEFADKVKEGAGKQQGPSPEQIQAQADAQAKQADAQMKQQDMQLRVAELQQKQQSDGQQAQADLQKTGAEIQKIFAEIERINAQTHQAMQPKPEPAGQPA